MYPDGYTIPGSNVTLMSIWFTVLGDGVSSVNIATNIPLTPIEVINSAGIEVFNNSIFNSGGSSTSGASITGWCRRTAAAAAQRIQDYCHGCVCQTGKSRSCAHFCE
jgi:hypothetical protein